LSTWRFCKPIVTSTNTAWAPTSTPGCSPSPVTFCAECTRRSRRAVNEHNYLEHLLVQRLDQAVTNDHGAADLLASFLADCLKTLKLEAQTLLALRYRDGLQVKAIADQLARSATSVSVQLFGLRKLLRDCVTRKQAQAAANPDSCP
jgi:DNA-directed RNA polymerase specialized sigma24 family protein